jgi:hypothetical protein
LLLYGTETSLIHPVDKWLFHYGMATVQMTHSTVVSLWNGYRTGDSPQVYLGVVCLRYPGKAVQLRQKLDSVVGLDVVKPEAEYLQQCVQDSPRLALEHVWQNLTCTSNN